MHGKRDWMRLMAIGSGLLGMAIAPEAASAQASIPFSGTNLTLSTASPTFTVNLNMLTAPDRPQLRVIATPDAGHANMTLQIQIDQCPLFGLPPVCFDNQGQDVEPWTSPSAPGAVNWLAPVWQCIPAPRDENVTGIHPPDGPPQCNVQVTATNFGSGGSPAHFNLQIQGETKPVTGTAQTVVNPAGGTTDGTLTTDRVNFITDATNFRWIYDANHDFKLDTFQPTSHAHLGRCDIDPNQIDPNGDLFALPYHYTYLGSPSYVGYDCCTWQMDSVESGTTGSGQALFYVNVGLNNPPPDSDGDGFVDPCDNCKNKPNGPFLGTCVTPAGVTGGSCLSNQQCAPPAFCSMAQEDNDFDPGHGLVCLPEPDATTMLASGVLALAALEHRRRRSVSLRASC